MEIGNISNSCFLWHIILFSSVLSGTFLLTYEKELKATRDTVKCRTVLWIRKVWSTKEKMKGYRVKNSKEENGRDRKEGCSKSVDGVA